MLPAPRDDFRLYHLRAIAYADRFESRARVRRRVAGPALCDRPQQPAVAPCGDADRSRLSLLKSTLERMASIDMRNDPALAKEKIIESLHPVYLPKRKPRRRRRRWRPAAGATLTHDPAFP